MRRLVPVLALALLWALACSGLEPAPDPGLSVDAIVGLVRKDVADKQPWASAVRGALVAAGRVPDEDHVCQVLATIEQESGYEADPEVPGLAKIVMAELEVEAKDKLGFLGPAAVGLLLDVTPEGETKSFRARLEGVRTERDLDRLFRDMQAHHAAKAPRLARALDVLAPRLQERLNPISTAGSMQVSVSFALAQTGAEGLSAAEVRERLYTIDGGVLYGTLRLFAHEAAYERPIYRFADYNAGLYASRNAAFQGMLRDLVGAELTPDGDLLIWNDRGRPTDKDGQTMQALLAWRASLAPDLLETQLRRDVKREKELAFESTETWRRVRESWAAKKGAEPAYASVPDVALDSPKLRKDRTTRWFAESVERRYKDCLKRNG